MAGRIKDESLQKRLRATRRLRGVKQEEISRFLGVKRQTYSAYERGVSVPDSITLKKLADYFEVSIEAFFHDPEQEEDPLVLQENQLIMLARKASVIPKEQRDRLIRNFEENIDMYLEAIGTQHNNEDE